MADIQAFLAKAGQGSASFIVSMPTGSGKSGVIALLAQRDMPETDVLLLAPWDALVKQLQNDVHEKFWRHARIEGDFLRPIRLLPSTAGNLLNGADGRTIWICTLATLQSLNQQELALLQSRVGTVVVDEGHYEPAPAWALSVRGLNRPTVIFTATPYRNDAKYFDVRPEDMFRYSHKKAMRDRLLRRVEFLSIDTSTAGRFVQEVADETNSRLDDTERVIVRCSNSTTIRQVVAELHAIGETAIGIHERFRSSDHENGLLKDVPSTEHPARFWVHQNKLIEGVDNQSFRAVAFHAPMANERGLVQQIGRVLRRQKSDTRPAYVFSPNADALQESWNTYLEYDSSTPTLTAPFRAVLDALPPLQYVNGAYRRVLDPAGVAPEKLNFPKSVNVYVSRSSSTGTDLIEEISAELAEQMEVEDYVPIGPMERFEPNLAQDVLLATQPFVMQQQSRFLRREMFLDISLGLAVVAICGQYVFFQSSGNMQLPSSTFRRLTMRELRPVFNAQAQRFTSVTLSNTDFGDDAERTRSQSARSLDLLAPDLGDYAKAPSTLTGVAQSIDRNSAPATLSRYVGFDNARIRESGMLRASAYSSWIRELHAAIVGNSAPQQIFDRYAELVEPHKFKPVNVLFDFDFAAYAVEIVDKCIDIENNSLEISVEGRPSPFKATLQWANDRFEFHCAELDATFPPEDPSLWRISDAINRDQAFRVLVLEEQPTAAPTAATTRSLVYVNSVFALPRVQLTASSSSAGITLGHLITGSPEMLAITSEKGRSFTRAGSNWEAGSLFHLINRVTKDLKFCGEVLAERRSDLLVVCDDDSGETADFYIVNEKTKRLIVIHAKRPSKSTAVGASGLHDVTSQALKHLGTIRAGAGGFSKTRFEKRWSKPWKIQSRTAKRIRTRHTAKEAVNLVETALRDPRYTREVWIVMANGLEKKAFLKALRSRAPKPTALQALYLVQSAWSSISATGAKFRLFVDEKPA